MKQTDSHTIVVGAGVIGVATAYYLALRGQRVTLLDQGDVCSGCSQGNAGQITPGHLPLTQPGTLWRNLKWVCNPKSPLFIPPRFDVTLLRWLWRFQRACNRQHLRSATEVLCQLGAKSSRLFEQLAEQLDFRYQKQGRLEICRSESTLDAVWDEAQLLKACGFEARRMSWSEVGDFEPAVSGELAGAVYFPDSGYCDPYQFVLALAEAAKRLGVTFHTNTLAQDLRVENHRVTAIITEDDEMDADSVVLACGSWTPTLARRLGLRLPIQAGKGYHLDLSRPTDCPRIPLVLVEERVYVTPLDDRLRLAGTMELSGFNLIERPARIEMLSLAARRYFAGVEQAQVQSHWCHLRPMTPDGLPVIGKGRRIDNAYIAAGHGMLGITQGPITGQLLADWIVDGQPSFDLSPLSPERF